MRFLLSLFLLSTVGWTVALAQDANDADSNIACVERIQLPLHDYYQLVQQSRIQGTITASVFLTQNVSAIRNRAAICIFPSSGTAIKLGNRNAIYLKMP
jgi:hypothetical protein